ncbi:MAG: T9SS type A sorting domain-containing protein, partial [Flavobacteriales bacterium]|nr:T9SS type A sorting domain-containing protein [Flavobacteriales bacterium]
LFVFDVTEAIGTNEIASDGFKVIIFPNPFLETFIISTKDFKETSFQLTNLNGQILKEGNLLSSMETITLNKLPVGTYLLKVSSSGNTITKKLVKSN